MTIYKDVEVLVDGKKTTVQEIVEDIEKNGMFDRDIFVSNEVCRQHIIGFGINTETITHPTILTTGSIGERMLGLVLADQKWIVDKFNYCPYCGMKLDWEVLAGVV